MSPRASHLHAKTCGGGAASSCCSSSSSGLGRCASSMSFEPCIEITQQTTCLKRSAVAGRPEQTTSGCMPCCTTRTVTMINHGLHPSSNRARERQRHWRNVGKHAHDAAAILISPRCVSTMDRRGKCWAVNRTRNRALQPSRKTMDGRTSARAELHGCH